MSRGRRAILLLSLAVVTCLVIGLWALRSNESPAPLPAPVAATPAEPPPAPASVEPPPAANPVAAFATLRGRVIDAATREPVREFELRFADGSRAQKFR